MAIKVQEADGSLSTVGYQECSTTPTTPVYDGDYSIFVHDWCGTGNPSLKVFSEDPS